MTGVTMAWSCAGDTTEPGTPPVVARQLDSLVIAPALAVLSIHEAGQIVRLTTQAYDQAGIAMQVEGGPTYSVESPAIASVSPGGIVTAVAPGGTRIIASVSAGGITRTASMLLVVERPAVEVVSIFPAVVGLQSGRTAQLSSFARDIARSVIREPATWSSDAPAVATVSSTGLVTAVGPGRALITASLTASGATRADTAIVQVFGSIDGIYDLVAPVMADPARPDLAGRQYVATLRLSRDTSLIPGITGSFTDLRLIGPNVAVNPPLSGTVASAWCDGWISAWCTGTVTIELHVPGTGFFLTLQAEVLEPVMEGTFYIEYLAYGSFTATRRTVQ